MREFENGLKHRLGPILIRAASTFLAKQRHISFEVISWSKQNNSERIIRGFTQDVAQPFKLCSKNIC